MANFLKKKSKLIMMIYAVLVFGVFLFGLFFSTNYAHVHVFYSIDAETKEVEFAPDYAIEVTEDSNKYIYDYFYKATDAGEFQDEIAGYKAAKNKYGFEDGGYAKTVYDFQMAVSSYNNQIVIFAVVCLVLICVLFICGNNSRKVFYKSNVVSGVVVPVIIAAYSIVMIILDLGLMSTFNKNEHLFKIVGVMQNGQITAQDRDILMGDYKALLEKASNINSVTFVVAIAIFAIVIVYSILMAAYSVYRYKESAEKRAKIIERAVNNND